MVVFKTGPSTYNVAVRLSVTVTFLFISMHFVDSARAQDAAISAMPGDRLTDISINAGETYDSNVARSSSAIAESRGIKQGDEIFSPGIEVDLARPLGRTELFLSGGIGYNFYATDTVLNRQFANVHAGGIVSIYRCNLTPTVSFSSNQSDLEQLIGTTRGSVRNTQTLPAVGLNLACPSWGKISPIGSVIQSWSRNSGSLYELSDYDSTLSNLGVDYKAVNIGDVQATIQYSYTSYPDRPQILGLTDSYQMVGGGLGYTKVVDPKIQLNLTFNYTSVSSGGGAAAQSSDFSGPTYAIGVKYTPRHRITINGNYARTVSPANLLGATYMVEGIGYLNADYELGTRSDLAVGASYSDRDYKGDAQFLHEVGIYDKETIAAAFATLNYRFSRRLSIKFDARYEQRRANLSLYNYDDARAGITLSDHFK